LTSKNSLTKTFAVAASVWADASGRSIIVPHIPFRTEVIRQRIVMDMTGEPLRWSDEDDLVGDAVEDDAVAPERAAKRAENRAFWQKFIDTVHFDHPDQPPPMHGGNNWVRIPLPSPAKWLTVYRKQDGRMGAFLLAEKGSDLIGMLAEDMESIRLETGLPMEQPH
jgi:hypothetical protein